MKKLSSQKNNKEVVKEIREINNKSKNPLNLKQYEFVKSSIENDEEAVIRLLTNDK